MAGLVEEADAGSKACCARSPLLRPAEMMHEP